MFELGELGVLAVKTACTDVADGAADELLAALGELEAVHRAVDAAMAHVIGELDVRRVTDQVHGHRTATWLAWTQGLPRGECRRRVRMARFLRTHPVVDAALRDGRISVDHVAALDRWCTPRVAEVVQRVQGELVDLAQGVRFETWARQVHALLDLADQDGGHEPRMEDNRLSVTDGLDGTVHLDGGLVGQWGLEAKAALEAEADRLFHRFTRDAEVSDGRLAVPPRNVLLALAFVELVRAGRAATHPGAGPVADVTLVIHTDLPDRVATADGTKLDAHTAATSCCDPVVHYLVVDNDGDPLRMGRSRRFAGPALRRAAAVRDGGCCFPGCDAPPSWTDLHHVHHWDHHGPTDIDNLASLCRHHHGVVHRRGWAVRTVDGQRLEITTPDGRTLVGQRHGRPAPAGPPPPRRTGPPG